MTDKPNDALKACPFCEGEAEWNTGQKGDGTPWHYIACSECEAMGSCNSTQREGQILDWNTRSIDIEEILEVMERTEGSAKFIISGIQVLRAKIWPHRAAGKKE